MATLLLGFALSQAGAATYYVSTAGNDSGSGTAAQPWRTIQKAATTVAAGDSVYVQAGSYNERVNCNSASGTASSRITFVAVGEVTLYGWACSRPYYTIEGFRVTGVSAPLAGIIWIGKAAHGVELLHNTLAPVVEANAIGMDTGDWGLNPSNCVIRGNLFTNTLYTALYMQGHGHLVESNTWTTINGWDAIRGFACNTIYRANVFSNWSNLTGSSEHADIIQAYSVRGEMATNVVFERNLIINCQDVQMGMFDDESAAHDHIRDWTFRNNIYANTLTASETDALQFYNDSFKFYNNVFYRVGVNAGGAVLVRYGPDRGSGHNAEFYNNIFVRCSSQPQSTYYGWYSVDDGVQNVQADNNLVIGTGAGTTKNTAAWTRYGESQGLNGVDPLLVITDSDFHLQSGSPCIDRGRPINGFGIDHDGAVRPQGSTWDIGAYEYGGVLLARPGAPTDLRCVLP